MAASGGKSEPKLIELVAGTVGAAPPISCASRSASEASRRVTSCCQAVASTAKVLFSSATATRLPAMLLNRSRVFQRDNGSLIDATAHGKPDPHSAIGTASHIRF